MPGLKKSFTKEDCQKFNQIRIDNQGKTLSYSEMKELIGKAIKGGHQFATILMQSSDVIQKVSRGQYKFKAEPLYIGKMQSIWDARLKKSKQEKDPVEAAIELLKSKGYKIQQMEFDYDKAMLAPNLPVAKFISWVEV